jgi:vacuolar protein sorting-associated protein 13A/C
MVNVSFKNMQFGNSTFVFNFLKKALGKALASFDRAPLKLKGIELSHTYGTKTNVVGILKQRYKAVTVDTIMGIILSSNFIGNPTKLFNKVSSGFNDLIDKPVKGFLEGPIEGGIGILAGAGSFAAKTVGATFQSLHNIADSVANGMAALSGDNDYMARREKRLQKENKNVFTGSYQALHSVGRGIYGGISGTTYIHLLISQ